MRKKSAHHHPPPKGSFKTLRTFLFVVFFFIVISLAIRIFLAIKAGRYSPSHRFTIGVLNNSQVLKEVVSFDPVDRSAVVLAINGSEKRLSPEQILGVAFDDTITTTDKEAEKQPSTLLMDSFLHKGVIRTSLETVDMIRLWLLANSLDQSAVMHKTLSLPLDTLQIDKLSSSLFPDPLLVSENQTIQIINSTTEPGFGKRLERMLANMGGNVVLVSTAQLTTDRTKLVYYGDETASVRRLSRILGLVPEKAVHKTIADIVIILGNSSLNTTMF